MNSRFEKIEKRLNCKFPSEFKKYLSSISSEDILLKLFDNDYRILYSITKENNTDWYEGVVNMSMDLSQSSFGQKDKDLIKIPFAKIVGHDGLKYMYFLGKKGKESNGEIYIQHLNEPNSKRIRISENINFIKGIVSKDTTKTIVDCTIKTFKEIADYITVSKKIDAWPDSFDILLQRGAQAEEERVELNKIEATVNEIKGASKSFIKLKVHLSIKIGSKLVVSSKAYKINVPKLKAEVEKNVNYSIFYHKFICSLNCLDETLDAMLASGDIDISTFNEIFDIESFINQVKKNFNQVNIEKERMTDGFANIEQTLNCKFPFAFKQYISELKKEEIILKLFDEDYRILYSITKKGELKDTYEDVVKCSANHDESYYPEDKGFKKLPFARALSGDRFKFLYFLCEEGKESNGEIYIRDTDSPQTGRIKVSKNIDLIKGDIAEEANKIIVDCRNKTFEKIVNFISPSDNIRVWKGSFGKTVRENTEGKSADIDISEVDATIFEYEDKSENFAKIEVQMKIITSEKIIFSSKAYEIGISGLKAQIENNINYRIFYHKFICCLDCLNETINSSIESNEITTKEIDNIFNISDFIAQVKKGFIQIDYRG